MSFGGRDYEILLANSGDPSVPDTCDISTGFSEDFLLPHADVRKLYNALKSVEHSVRLNLVPDEEVIAVTGVSTTLAVESITGRALAAALRDLDMSAELFRARLTGEDDYDSWSADGGPAD